MAVTLTWLKKLFADRFLLITFACALLAVTLAYQFRQPFEIQVGGPIDGPLLSHFHAPEQDAPTGMTFRWTNGDSSVNLVDWGAGNPVELHMRVARWRPNEEIADLSIFVNGIEFTEPEAAGSGWQEYTFPITDAKFLASDNLNIRFESDTFVPKKRIPGNPDTRPLGITVDWVQLRPLTSVGGHWRGVEGLVWSPFKLPPFDLVLYFMGSVLTTYVGLVLFKIPRGAAWLLSVSLALVVAVALVWARPYITIFAGTFLACLLVSFAASWVARMLVPRFFAWGGVRASEWDVDVLALLFGLAVLLKLGMLLYPQTISYDLLYHIHRLQFLLDGKFFWTIESGKNEFGGQPVPYVPSFYIFLMPFANFLPLSLLVQLSGVLLDSVTVFFIYYLVKKYLDDGRAGLFAAWIYILAPLAFIALSWGIYANIYGQFLTLLLVVALIEGLDRLTHPRAFVVVALLFALTLLSHTSVFASIVPMFAIWIALLLLLGRAWRARPLWALLAAIAVASLTAFTVYYSEFVGMMVQGTTQIVSSSTDPTSAPVGDSGLTFWQLLQPARTDHIAVPLYIYVAAFLGLVWMVYLAWHAPLRGRFLLITMLAAWFAAFGVLIYVRANFGFSSRYVNFVMPAIALCAGVALAWVYRRGLAARALSLGIAVLLAAQGFYALYDLVMFHYH